MLALTFGRQKLVGYVHLIRAGKPLAASGLAPLIRAIGLPAPGLLGVCAVLFESIGASLVAVGFMTRLTAAIGACDMAVAFYVSVRLGEDPYRAALYCIIFAALAVAGPGRVSVDDAIRRRRAAVGYRGGQLPGRPEGLHYSRCRADLQVGVKTSSRAREGS